MTLYEEAAKLIKTSEVITVFTGAGISYESGIPTFRGENGLWEKYDMKYLTLSYFREHSLGSWVFIKKVIFDIMEDKDPNQGHHILSQLEKDGFIEGLITQNIDNLHQEAGSKNTYELHGNTRKLQCLVCDTNKAIESGVLKTLPPLCPSCGSIMKPDFTFFEEALDEQVLQESEELAKNSDLMIVIGTTGVVQPAALLPWIVKDYGGKIIEINPKESAYTNKITDLFIKDSASIALEKIYNALMKEV